MATVVPVHSVSLLRGQVEEALLYSSGLGTIYFLNAMTGN